MTFQTLVPWGRDHPRGAAHRADLADRAGITTFSVGMTALAVAVMARNEPLAFPLWLRVVVGLLIGLTVSVLTGWLLRSWRRPEPPASDEDLPGPTTYDEGQDSLDASAAPGPEGDRGRDDAPGPDHVEPPPEPDPDRDPELVHPPDPARWRDVEVDPTDRRALLLLVRSLEAALEEQHVAITALQSLRTAPPEADRDAREAPDDLPIVASGAGADTELGPRRTPLVMEALSHLDGPAASARIDAAIGRLGAPALFVRPPLAAFLPPPEARGDQPVAEETTDMPDAAQAMAPAPPPEPVPQPVPEVVLPVPARPRGVPAPRRRRLFRSSAA
jgi:hypothetical protein